MIILRSILTSFLFVLVGVSIQAEDTTIKGGRMELLNKGAEVVFSHGVRLSKGTDTMDAEEMRTNQDRDKVTAIGNVRLLRKSSSTETWKGFADKGFYDTQAGTGYLIGTKKRAYITRNEVLSSTISRVIELWADRIDFFREPRGSKARGNVHGKTVDPQTKDQYEFFAEQADYDGKKKELVLSGRNKSKAVQSGGGFKRKVEGRVITYYVDSGRLVSAGDAEAVMENLPKERN